MRTGFRVLGWIVAVLAILLLARDLFVLAQSGAWAPIDVGPLWNALHPGSLQLAQPAIERHVHPYLWDPLLLGVLLTPAFVVLGVLAALILLLAGRRRGRRARRYGG